MYIYTTLHELRVIYVAQYVQGLHRFTKLVSRVRRHLLSAAQQEPQCKVRLTLWNP